ncbi:MAG TPA: NADH-quinone oxidoreductase subunit J [Geothrix sp.]|nr:NADH-quinone oxidoreductase subunit J [Geothrix sp.]
MFLAFATLALAGAIALLLQKNAIEAGLCMALSFLGVSGLFVLLGNPVAAALQIIVYAGAILILVLFVIMLLNSHEEEPAETARPIQRWGSVALVAGLGLGAYRLITASPALAELAARPVSGPATNLHSLGDMLFSQHLLGFEVAGFLLLATMIGAVALVKKNL